ncbi:hypothetical protein Tsubulata_034179 [Turnera subulata]|uniref:Fe2OG dioxygenase domain-containing protein n=1 Tax=Turnera subulata TaxID=218843 RepID=A0A9Q0GEW0_9ROSI|nr:hypothetical protein Tsubulata_034179 [Turnera subulata]
MHQPMLTTIKALAESPGLNSIPSTYTFTRDPQEAVSSESEDSIPIIDFSLLSSGTPDQRSKIIHELGKACQEWGFFMRRRRWNSQGSMCGTSINASVEKVHFWRDFLKVHVHPVFHSPHKPAGLREVLLEYIQRTREVYRKLLYAISESLGLEELYIDRAMNVESGLEFFVANLYPPCPQPDLAMGLPPHTDPGVLTLLIQNGISGLQLQHNGKWVTVNGIPNSFLVNVGDQLEILSNGQYKGVLHRAVVNNGVTRMSILVPYGPSLDAVVGPAPKLTDGQRRPPAFMGIKDPQEAVSSESEDSIPIIDFSLLSSGTPDQRSKIIHELGKACQEWGFFMCANRNACHQVINHGVPESLMKAVMNASREFFDLTEEEKMEFPGKHVLDPIKCGTSVNASVEKVHFWRDFFRVHVHPDFHSPHKPAGLRELLLEYSQRTREVARNLLKAISESLGLEELYIDKAMNMESGVQIFVANLYPPCPQPEFAMGLPPHSDHGLLTLLIQNGVRGLQLLHNGKWVNVNGIPNSFLVNTGDQLEIMSNGRYKSLVHRAVVNNEVTRISIALPYGPSLDAVVRPAPELTDRKHQPPAYLEIRYSKYLELLRSNVLDVSVPLASQASIMHQPKLTTVKALAESPGLTSIPSAYTFTRESQEAVSDPEESLPIIDLSLLSSGTPDQRSKIIHDLGKACQEWGFFTVINHGVPESLMKAMMDACREFFDLPEEEKREFAGKHVLDPIRCGTSFNTSVEKVFCWRDFLKIHPHYVTACREVLLEYIQRTREVYRKLLNAISESLGLEELYIDRAMNVESGLEFFVANLYPPCPQPDLAMGLPPHTDPGLLSLLIQNGIAGLQLQHNGKWVTVNCIPNSFLVNTGAQLEILSNGKYKAVVHRAAVNNDVTRMTIVIPYGPSPDALVRPAPELTDSQCHPPAFMGIKYGDYLKLQQSKALDDKSDLDRLRLSTIKALAESPGLTSIPSTYTYARESKEAAASSESEDSIPIIDFSLLSSDTPEQRSKIIHELGKACQEWGFFMVTNHGVPENLMKAVMDASREFFDLTEEEKKEFVGKHVLDPIRCGTSFNASVDKVFFWRDFLKVIVHPDFHSPHKPAGFREVTEELLKAISASLGLEELYIVKAMNMDSGLQIFVANLYPPCPQPDLAMGMPPHSDHGLLTLLIQNGVGGLQLQRNGKWVTVNGIPNSFLVNTGDHLEILSNGKYKSVVHRAVVNNDVTRISIALPHGPSLDAVVKPAAELTDSQRHPPAYKEMAYGEYLQLQQSNVLDTKSCLDRVRLQN